MNIICPTTLKFWEIQIRYNGQFNFIRKGYIQVNIL